MYTSQSREEELVLLEVPPGAVVLKDAGLYTSLRKHMFVLVPPASNLLCNIDKVDAWNSESLSKWKTVFKQTKKKHLMFWLQTKIKI